MERQGHPKAARSAPTCGSQTSNRLRLGSACWGCMLAMTPSSANRGMSSRDPGAVPPGAHKLVVLIEALLPRRRIKARRHVEGQPHPKRQLVVEVQRLPQLQLVLALAGLLNRSDSVLGGHLHPGPESVEI